MNIEPYASNVACAGTEAPKCDQILELIQLLVTIHERFGNTAIKYRVQWGSSALWAEDGQKQEIERLKKQVARLKKKVSRVKG